MNPDACMQRLLNAIEDQDREECAAATDDLAAWLDKGGFPPRFKSAWAGTVKCSKFGEPRRYLRLGAHNAIMTVDPNSDKDGWVWVRYNAAGDAVARYKLAVE